MNFPVHLLILSSYISDYSSFSERQFLSASWLCSDPEEARAAEELNLGLMADMLQADWVSLARQTRIRETDILAAQVRLQPSNCHSFLANVHNMVLLYCVKLVVEI